MLTLSLEFSSVLWFKDNDPNGQSINFRMNIHPFGALPSGGAANFGLRRTAEAGPEEFGEEVADFLQNESYFDDSLKSFASQEDAISIIRIMKPCAQLSTSVHKLASSTEQYKRPYLQRTAPKT